MFSNLYVMEPVSALIDIPVQVQLELVELPDFVVTQASQVLQEFLVQLDLLDRRDLGET